MSTTQTAKTPSWRAQRRTWELCYSGECGYRSRMEADVVTSQEVLLFSVHAERRVLEEGIDTLEEAVSWAHFHLERQPELESVVVAAHEAEAAADRDFSRPKMVTVVSRSAVLKSAGDALWKKLLDDGVPVASVGVTESLTEFVVYVHARPEDCAVPTIWRSLRVSVRASAQVKFVARRNENNFSV